MTLVTRQDLLQKLTEIKATFIISPRGILQITISGDLGAFIQLS